ncbi:hypothetical protein [Lacibacter sp.]|uniref:hypothetical protein n=1 Tax=Lacibacter sp. TaxID=1915409 RepID=UPI002B4AD63F|nr:hypothetical protein [Lacibacter sp.]HLP38354.1 hypothetical protein [Lacibacter sp.]
MTAKLYEAAATKAIKAFRKKKLSQGFPFMINSDVLISSQCYLEYPDGSIKIVEANTKKHDFHVVYELSERDADDIRRKYKLV